MAREHMPIVGARMIANIPWDFIAPHEAQALSNHGQSLERLAQRGGLGHSEAIDSVMGYKWSTSKTCIENERWLINKVREWSAAQREQQP